MQPHDGGDENRLARRSQEAGQTANQQLLLCIELGAAESYDKLLELPKEARLENAVQRAKS